ncbi:MAG: carbohydrate-binding family 9-like protein [Deltaproteobacteria bacterium]|nr:carbohydrate-binding family 9-like protein [Deltaproteobacteria bacterium]
MVLGYKSIRLKSGLIILLSLLGVLVTGCGEPAKTYHVRSFTNETIVVDGKLEEKVWENTNCESSFVFPWQTEIPPKTMFRAFYDEDGLFFSFSVEDRDLVYDRNRNDEMVLTGEDRVEIYFAKDEMLKDYYCIEIDPLGRVLDYSAHYYRNFDVDWDWNGLKTAAVMTEQGYNIEGMIPLDSLAELFDETKLKVGLYRAEISLGPEDALIEEWISWVDPKTREPDFHTPSSFGSFIFDGVVPVKPVPLK